LNTYALLIDSQTATPNQTVLITTYEPIVANSSVVKVTLFNYTEEFEDTKGTIRIRISKKNKQHSGQKKKDKLTNNDLQNITQKSEDRATRNPLITGVNSGAPEG
jgi:hypothetical protein